MRLARSTAASLSATLTFLEKSLRVIMTSSSGCALSSCPRVMEGTIIR